MRERGLQCAHVMMRGHGKGAGAPCEGGEMGAPTVAGLSTDDQREGQGTARPMRADN
jgi:hypothetical protein